MTTPKPVRTFGAAPVEWRTESTSDTVRPVKTARTFSRVRPQFWNHDEADRRPILKGQRLRLWWARNAENVWAAVIVLGVWWFAWLCAGYL